MIARTLSILLLLAVLPPAAADTPPKTSEEAEQRLSQVQQQMRTLRRLLEQKRGEQGRLQAELRRQDRQIARLSRNLREIERKLAELRHTLAVKRRERRDQLAVLERHRQALAQQLRTAYRIGDQEGLKLLLNQQDPALVGRMLAYYQRFNAARLARIRAINEALADLRAIEAEIGRKQQNLEQKQQQKREALARLKATRKERQRTLKALSDEIRRHGKALETLAEDEQQLQALIASINEALADIPATLDRQDPFPRLRGRLRLPVRGRVLARYGDRRKGTGGRMRWKGLVIQAPRGRTVQAVARGRVAFADWMRGLGLLVIIDHGDGFLSLYGHNEALFVEPGDWIEAGDTIATIGDSGGAPRPELYFELRRAGKPVDPAPWFGRNLARN